MRTYRTYNGTLGGPYRPGNAERSRSPKPKKKQTWKSAIWIFPFVGFVRPKAESDHNVMNPTATNSNTATSDLLPAKVEDDLLRLLCLLLLIYSRTGVSR